MNNPELLLHECELQTNFLWNVQGTTYLLWLDVLHRVWVILLQYNTFTKSTLHDPAVSFAVDDQ